MNLRAVALLGVLALMPPTESFGQTRPRAVVTPVVETDAAHAGQTIRVALKVTLPATLHVQSDQPRDPSFIPTALSLEPRTVSASRR